MNEISYVELEKLQTEKEITLLDVRENDERQLSNIGGLHIPMTELQQRVEEIPVDKPIVCYCRSGGRSAMALQFIQDRLSPQVELINLAGGMEATGIS